MKLKKLILPLLLVLPLISCNKESESEVIGHEDDITRYTYKGTHSFNTSITDEYIVKNKVSDYKIVVPYNPSTQIINAQEELKSLFLEATGVLLDVVNEDAGGLPHTVEGKYFSIGDTKMFASSGLSVDKAALGVQAARVITKDKTVYLNGGDDLGALFAVYDMLEVYFNFDTFSYDCIHLDKKDNLNFYTMDITDIPDIRYRANAWASIKENNNNLAYRLRTPNDFGDYFIPLADTEAGAIPSAIHNSLDIIPKESTLGILNKDYWFGDNGIEQICYTAHGDQDRFMGLVNRTAYIVEQGLKTYTPEKYPLKDYISFTIEDNNSSCKCPACVAANEKYGAESGAVIVFCNKVMEVVRAWMDDPLNAAYRRENLKLVFFAYNNYIASPSHYDEETKKYVVNHADLVMRPDVGVYYAVSRGLNYQKNIYDASCSEGLKMLREWCDIASITLLWTYNANFGDYLSHIDSANFYNQDAYQAFANGGVALLYNQGAWNSYNLTAYQMLSIYLDAKLSWNSNADMAALTDKFFNYMYGSAATEMKELYHRQQLHSLLMYEKAGVLANTGIINRVVGRKDFYSLTMLQSWVSICEQAWKKIEPYKETDYEKYMMLKEHIDLEWVSPAYYLLNLYGSTYMSNDQYTKMVNYFVTEILPLKDFKLTERGSFLSVWINSLISAN